METAPTGVPNQETPKETASNPAPTGVSEGASSSAGPNGPFPAELNHWNWGAFLMSWIWAIGNNVWIGLLGLIPSLNLIIMIILGIKGNEWAWQHRKFESVDQFNKVQAAWTKWGIILFILRFVIGIGVLTLFLFTIYNYADPSIPVY